MRDYIWKLIFTSVANVIMKSNSPLNLLFNTTLCLKTHKDHSFICKKSLKIPNWQRGNEKP
jgi:hypothetical protein